MSESDEELLFEDAEEKISGIISTGF